MAKKPTRTPHLDLAELASTSLGRLAGCLDERAGTDPMPDTGAMAAPIAAEVELAMRDLVGDANGEIVFFNDSGLRRLLIASDVGVVADGRAGAHRTAAGQDVSGFRFLRFDNGLTLYYEPALDVVVRDAR